MPDHVPHPVAIITGASSGIGLCVARRLAAGGWSVVLAARDEARLNAAAASLAHDDPACRGRLAVIPADVALPHDAHRLVLETLDRFGRIDAVVNNAGFAPMAPIERHTHDMLARVFAVNAVGPATLIAAAWPTFVRQRRGCVVNVSSMAAKDPFPGFFGYAGAKAGLILMARSCANEGAIHGVRAFAVAPGAVETPMLRSLFSVADLSTEVCLKPEFVAGVIVDCIEGRRDQDNGGVIWLPAGREC